MFNLGMQYRSALICSFFICFGVSVVFVRENPIRVIRIVSYALYVMFGYTVLVCRGSPHFSIVSFLFVFLFPCILLGFGMIQLFCMV